MKEFNSPLSETDGLKQSDDINGTNRKDLSHIINKFDLGKLCKALHPKFENIHCFSAHVDIQTN